MAFGRTKRSEFLSYDDFVEEAKAKNFGPLYLFIGKEDFLVDECIRHIVDTIVPSEMRGFDLDVMYGGKSDAKDVIAHASSYPMMGNRRVVVVREFERLVLGEVSKEIIAGYIQHLLESTCLVLVSGEPDFRKRPFTELKKAARIISCDQLYDNQIPSWIAARVRLKKKDASPEACRMLQAYVGNSLRSLDNEIDKLLIYIGDRREITGEDIGAVVGASKGYTVFDLQNCIGKKDVNAALSVLARMMQAGENAQLIIVMLTRFFTMMLRISELKEHRTPESQFAAELKISPYFLKQYLDYHAKLSPSDIENGFRALLSADAAMKSSIGDPRIVLDLLVYSLIKNTRLEPNPAL